MAALINPINDYFKASLFYLSSSSLRSSYYWLSRAFDHLTVIVYKSILEGSFKLIWYFVKLSDVGSDTFGVAGKGLYSSGQPGLARIADGILGGIWSF